MNNSDTSWNQTTKSKDQTASTEIKQLFTYLYNYYIHITMCTVQWCTLHVWRHIVTSIGDGPIGLRMRVDLLSGCQHDGEKARRLLCRKHNDGIEHSQNGDRLKRRHAYSKLTKMATHENGDKRKWRHSLNKYVIPFHSCFLYTCG